MPIRKEGQIWLDKNNTHRLKYYIDGVTYEVLTAQIFSSTDLPNVKKGQLVAATGSEVTPAVWPDDSEKVLGVVTGITQENNKHIISISSTGRIILTAEEISGCFVDGTRLPAGEWATSKKGIGCPVYWFIGLSKSDENYIDSTDEEKKGMLTFETPSGFKYGVTTVSDERFNISYDNLPIVGHVVDYECSKSGDAFTKLIIDLQASTYTPTVTWNYPGIHYGDHTCGKLENGSHRFYHGLFATNAKNNICICDLTIRAISANETYPEGTDAEEYTIVAPYRNVIKALDNRFTEVTLKTIDNLRYRITGTVHYNIDRSQA